jgi:type IV secretory pathway ATPase VirB11/archaellum biosynthesis ATPase
MLHELAEIYDLLVNKENLLAFSEWGASEACERLFSIWRETIRRLIIHGIKQDPIGAYVQLRRTIREEEIKLKSPPPIPNYPECAKTFIKILTHAADTLANTTLIKVANPYLAGHKPGTREIYRQIFKPLIQPHFMHTKLVTSFPTGAEEVESYKIPEETEILILKVPDDIRILYHLNPPEFRLSEELYEILGEAKEVMEEHRPTKAEFIDPQRTREIFFDVEKDLIKDLANSKGLKLNYKQIEELARILLRYTIGFGLIEVLLSDPKIQDISINAPAPLSSVSIIHADYGECKTNIFISEREAQSFATKLRLISGRPLDQANPVLDTRLILPYGTARVAAIQEPLSPSGLAYAFRRHRDKPWTLPLFITNRFMTSEAAGLISFLVDTARTMLIAGTRSAGKTSLLAALMTEIMRSSRIVTLEDTLELPVLAFKKMNYDIQSMKVQSVITPAKGEISAEEGIRTALRLGDSSLIIGEVRSQEAKALYEAMRVGALANVVAGTIHGASPYDVFDRVVNDLGVPKTSFKATDIILVANQVTSPSGLQRMRRLVQIAEVRKLWTEDPILEKGFADLLKYNPQKDLLEVTPTLYEGESEIIKAAGSRVREWAGNWDAIWENIQLRTKIKQTLVDTANKLNNKNILEAPFVVKSNDHFHKISEIIREEIGVTDPKRVYTEWEHWLNNELKK